jgi:hypothetical protein
MRVEIRRANTALANALSYDETLQPASAEPQSAQLQPLVEQIVSGGQRSAMRWSSEYRLLLAVLQDAVSSWFRYCRACTAREHRMFQEIYAWFWDKDCTWLYAFESICEYLDLDPNAIRRGLLRWQAAPLQQPMSTFQMRRVRRHRKIRPLCEDDDDYELECA